MTLSVITYVILMFFIVTTLIKIEQLEDRIKKLEKGDN